MCTSASIARSDDTTDWSGDDTVEGYGLYLPQAMIKANRPRLPRRLVSKSEGYAGTDRQDHLDLGGWVCRDVLRTTPASQLGCPDLIGSQELPGSTTVYVGQSGQKRPVSHSRQTDRQTPKPTKLFTAQAGHKI